MTRRDHLWYATPTTARHHVETFYGAGSVELRRTLGYRWGWQCFTCSREADGFDTEAAAEAAGAIHAGGDTT